MVGDFLQDGLSCRTRVLSFRSSNDRSIYGRKSINVPIDNLKPPNKNPCQCVRIQNNFQENGFRLSKTDELNNQKNGKRNVNILIDKRDMSKRRSLGNHPICDDSLPIGDERVSELYIFPNSSIVEFTDISYDEKV